MNLTPSLKPAQLGQAFEAKRWVLVDATDVPLGRLSSIIALHLRGKHRPDFTPHVDSGDNVIVINAEKIRVTGYKKQNHTFYWHTGYVGGIKGETIGETLDGKHPHRVVERAVKRMLPKSKLGEKQFKNLHVYAGESHPHEAQQPVTLNVAAKVAKKRA